MREVDKATFQMETRGLSVTGTETYSNGNRKDFYSFGPGNLVGCAYHTRDENGKMKVRYTIIEWIEKKQPLPPRFETNDHGQPMHDEPLNKG